MITLRTLPGIVPANVVGRYASHVRIRAGAFAGRVGRVTRIVHEGYVEVELAPRVRLGFGPSELEVIR